jgi:Lrp/AsnC family transcriptional regulator, leucine-responsive regulatory protein
MDETDFQILKILQKKARIPNVEVARTIEMAPSAVLKRIKKLETKGAIEEYEVRLNPDMFNCAMIAFIHVVVADPGKILETGKKNAEIDQVQEVHYMAGEDCLLAKIRVADNTELEAILRTQITCLKPVVGTKTLISYLPIRKPQKFCCPQSPREEY